MTYLISPKLNNNQRQIILGTVLGGSTIIKPSDGRNCYLAMRGSNAAWIQCKAQELKVITAENPYFVNRIGYHLWHSKCSPSLNEFRELFYKDGKKVVQMEVLNELRDIGLAIWFMDAGKTKDEKATFNTNQFDAGGTATISQYFSEIGFANEVTKAKGKKSFRVILDKKATQKFLETIGEYVPKFMI